MWKNSINNIKHKIYIYVLKWYECKLFIQIKDELLFQIE